MNDNNQDIESGVTGDPTALVEEQAFSEMDMQERMRWLRKKTLEHLWGPTGSVILHILVLVAAWHLISIEDKSAQRQIDVFMVDPDPSKLEDFERELDKLQEVDVQFDVPEFDVVMDAPPEERPLDNQRQQDDFAALDIRTDVQSPMIMRGLFSGRSASGRAALLKKYGGRMGGVTESAVLRALEWLKNHQLEDGSWSGTGPAISKTAMTGLGLLTFLAHGETTTSERYGPTVEKAIRFLVEQDVRTDGTFNNSDGAMYAHGIAAYALSEAYALTRIPSIKPAMERTVGRIVAGQQRTGSFNYRLNPADNRRDTSVAGWMVQAMKAAYIAGANVPGLKEAMDKAVDGFKINFHEPTKRFAYAPGAGADAQGGGEVTGSVSCTPIAVLGLQLLGRGNDVETVAGHSTLASWDPQWVDKHPSSWPLYTWYYATQAIFHGGGPMWDRWNNMFARMLVTNQNIDGSWTPNGRTEGAYGPVYGTTLAALSLMVYYRFLPTYQPIEAEAIPTEKRVDDIDVEIMSVPRPTRIEPLDLG
ncbi:MAG: prenyltransferase/squalene oxidase repeat-containing protein [Kiritimatiellia bacterium]|nr:prenyltransferase/squalene oxidase repeat-containing protein [Kiritimatiellia bacterium]